MWHLSKPPLHPKVLVGPKTPYNPIVVVDLDSEEGDGLIDLTSLEAGARTARKTGRGAGESRQVNDEVSAAAAAAAAEMAMASSEEDEEEYDDEVRDVPEPSTMAATTTSAARGSSLIVSVVEDHLSESVVRTYSNKGHVEQYQHHQQATTTATSAPPSTLNSSSSFGNMYRRAIKNRENQRRSKATETTPLRDRGPLLADPPNRDSHQKVQTVGGEQERPESPTKRHGSPQRLYEKAVKQMTRPASTERTASIDAITNSPQRSEETRNPQNFTTHGLDQKDEVRQDNLAHKDDRASKTTDDKEDDQTPRDIDSFIDLAAKTLWSNPWPVSSVHVRRDTAATSTSEKSGSNLTKLIDSASSTAVVASAREEQQDGQGVHATSIITIENGSMERTTVVVAGDDVDSNHWSEARTSDATNGKGERLNNGHAVKGMNQAPDVVDLPGSWNQKQRKDYGLTDTSTRGGEARSDINRHRETIVEGESVGGATDMARRENPEQHQLSQQQSPPRNIDPSKRTSRDVWPSPSTDFSNIHELKQDNDDRTDAAHVVASAQDSYVSEDDPTRVTLWSRPWSASEKDDANRGRDLAHSQDQQDGDGSDEAFSNVSRVAVHHERQIVVRGRSVSPSWSQVPPAAINSDVAQVLESEVDSAVYLGDSSMGNLPVVKEYAKYDGGQIERGTWPYQHLRSNPVTHLMSGRKTNASPSEQASSNPIVVNESTTSQNPIVADHPQTSQVPIVIDPSLSRENPIDEQDRSERDDYFARSEQMLNQGILRDMRMTASGVVDLSKTNQWSRPLKQTNASPLFVDGPSLREGTTENAEVNGSKKAVNRTSGVDVDLTNIRGFSSSPQPLDLTHQPSLSPSPPRRRDPHEASQTRQALKDEGHQRRVSPIRVDLTNVYSTSSGALSDSQKLDNRKVSGHWSKRSPVAPIDKAGADAETSIDCCSSGEDSSVKKRKSGKFSQVSIPLATNDKSRHASQEDKTLKGGGVLKRRLTTGRWSQPSSPSRSRNGRSLFAKKDSVGGSKYRDMNSSESPVRVDLTHLTADSPTSTLAVKSAQGNAEESSTVFEEDDSGVLDVTPTSEKNDDGLEEELKEVSSLIDLSKRTLWSQQSSQVRYNVQRNSEASDVAHLKVGDDFLPNDIFSNTAMKKAGAAVRDSLFTNMDVRVLKKDRKERSRTDTFLSELDENSLLDIEDSQWSASSTTALNSAVQTSPSSSTLDPVIHAGASHDSNQTKMEQSFQKQTKDRTISSQIIPEEGPAGREIIRIETSSFDNPTLSPTKKDPPTSPASAAQSPHSDRVGSVLERARALLSTPKSGDHKRQDTGISPRSTTTTTDKSFSGFFNDDDSGLITVAGTSRMSENEVTHVVDRSAVTKLQSREKASDNSLQYSRSTEDSHRFKRQGELARDSAVPAISDDSAFLKVRERLAELDNQKKSGPARSNNIDSDLQLDMKEFRDAVMPNENRAEQNLKTLLNGKKDGVIPIEPILSNYSQDLAISDESSSANSDGRSSQRTGSQHTSPYSVESQQSSFQASIPNSAKHQDSSKSSSFQVTNLVHDCISSPHGATHRGNSSTQDSLPSSFPTSLGKKDKKSTTPTKKAKRRADTKRKDEASPLKDGKNTTALSRDAHAKKHEQISHSDKDHPTPGQTPTDGQDKKKRVVFGMQPKVRDNSDDSRVAYDEDSDASMTRDTESKISLQSYLETDESDLETNFESSTVPMLVRMLDQSCAWLEDHNACGLDQPSLLSRSHVRKQPIAQYRKRGIRRSDKSKVHLANKTGSSRGALKRLLEDQEGETLASSKATEKESPAESNEARTPKKSNLKKPKETHSEPTQKEKVEATEGSQGGKILGEKIKEPSSNADNASYNKPIDVEPEHQRITGKDAPPELDPAAASSKKKKKRTSSSKKKKDVQGDHSKKHLANQQRSTTNGETAHQKFKNDIAKNPVQSESSAQQNSSTRTDFTSYKPKDADDLQLSSSDEFEKDQPSLRVRRSVTPLKLSTSPNHVTSLPNTSPVSSRHSRSPKKNMALSPENHQHRLPPSPKTPTAFRSPSSKKSDRSSSAPTPNRPSVSPQKNAATAPSHVHKPQKTPESPASDGGDPPSVSSNFSFQAKLKERLARIRGDDSSQGGSHSPVRDRLEAMTSPARRRAAGGDGRPPDTMEGTMTYRYQGGDSASYTLNYYEIYDIPPSSPKHRAAGGPEETVAPHLTRRSNENDNNNKANSPPKNRKKEDPEGDTGDHMFKSSIKSVGGGEGDGGGGGGNSSKKQDQEVDEPVADYSHLTEDERLAALELAEKLRRRAAALKRRKKLREMRYQEADSDDDEDDQERRHTPERVVSLS